MMNIFKSRNNNTEIFIRIWEWCPTWCQSCIITAKKNKEFNLKEVKTQIDISNNISDNNFSYFLYWTNNIINSNINKITTYINSLNRKYRIQIPIHTNLNNLKKINKKTINEYVISYKVMSTQDIKILIQSIKEFYNNKNIIINYDLLIKEELIPILQKILKIDFKEQQDNTVIWKIQNIEIHLRQLYFINYKEKKINNLWINSCFVYDAFEIKENYIEIIDHYEITKKLEITFHNPLCYIWNHKVTNLNKEKKEKIKDFIVYKNFLKNLNHDFEKNCFKCITNWFNYKKIN